MVSEYIRWIEIKFYHKYWTVGCVFCIIFTISVLVSKKTIYQIYNVYCTLTRYSTNTIGIFHIWIVVAHFAFITNMYMYTYYICTYIFLCCQCDVVWLVVKIRLAIQQTKQRHCFPFFLNIFSCFSLTFLVVLFSICFVWLLSKSLRIEAGVVSKILENKSFCVSFR